MRMLSVCRTDTSERKRPGSGDAAAAAGSSTPRTRRIIGPRLSFEGHRPQIGNGPAINGEERRAPCGTRSRWTGEVIAAAGPVNVAGQPTSQHGSRIRRLHPARHRDRAALRRARVHDGRHHLAHRRLDLRGLDRVRRRLRAPLGAAASRCALRRRRHSALAPVAAPRAAERHLAAQAPVGRCAPARRTTRVAPVAGGPDRALPAVARCRHGRCRVRARDGTGYAWADPARCRHAHGAVGHREARPRERAQPAGVAAPAHRGRRRGEGARCARADPGAALVSR